LRSVLESALGKSVDQPITTEEPAGLSRLLDAQNSNISDLTGLEYCASLTTLDLSGNQICNISPLTNLNGLSLDNNQIIFSKGHLIIFSKLQLGGTRVEADLASIHFSS